MIYSTLVTALFAVGSLAAPTAKRAVTDVEILNYALTLEYLEDAFYKGALDMFDQNAFVKGGLPDFARKRFVQISEHEASHVSFLKTALGSKAVGSCKYKFPYTTPKEFAALAMVLEGVGVGAYLGAAASITDKEYLTAAGSILTTESRHNAWVSSATNKGAAWSGPYDTPLDFDQVYSLAGSFIVPGSCTHPGDLPPLKAFPALTYSSTSPGHSTTLSTKATGGKYLAIMQGVGAPVYLEVKSGKVTLPGSLHGTSYAVLVKDKNGVTDDNTVAGPLIFNFPENEGI